MLYFSSDQHFFHHNVINMCNRPFADLDEMHHVLINNWNSVVGKLDEVYILGDFSFKGSGAEVNDVLKQLKGKKYLIRGNHEKYLSDSNFDMTAFEWVKDYEVISYKDARFILFHYPILEWAHYHRKSIHLHGHVHNNSSHISEDTARLSVLGNRAVNVGVDCNNFFPISVKVIYDRVFSDKCNLLDGAII